MGILDKTVEIRKFLALLQYVAQTGDDLSAELHRQREILRLADVGDAEIDNLIHDKHARKRADVAAEVRKLQTQRAGRHAPSIPTGFQGMRPSLPRERSREELAAEYLRARGREPLPTTSLPSRPPAPEVNPSIESILQADLRVPYGMDPDGAITHARDASPNIPYTCPGCTEPLVLRDGEVKVRHFAHKGKIPCLGESAAHSAAKHLIAKVIRENQHGPIPIRMQCMCERCEELFESTLPRSAFSAAEVEHAMGEFICDVVAMKSEQPTLAIEIVNTNPVDPRKAAALPIPWIELAADNVLTDPYYWRPAQFRLKPVICSACKKKEANLTETLARWHLAPPEAPYRAAVAPCWQCHEEIVWFWWPDVPFAEDQPPAGKPRTVQFRHSKTYGGKYWINTCPGCGASQGDNFVFLRRESPFAGLPLRDTDSMKAHRQRESKKLVRAFMGIVKRNFGPD